MYITASHTVQALTKDEERDLNIIKERGNFMDICWSYLLVTSWMLETLPFRKVENVTEDDNDSSILSPDIPVDNTTMPK